MPKNQPKYFILILLFTAILAFGIYKLLNLNSNKPIQATKQSLKKTSSQKIFFPINNYSNRLNFRRFGQLVKPEDSESLICGRPFEGFHTGDDLEISGSEVNQEIPVFSIADGQVLSISKVDGYGGLLIIGYQLNNQTITAYYGHINLKTVKVKENEVVVPGQLLAYLGDQCSQQSGFERKHLHFSLHKGSEIDLLGYITDSSQLKDWLNPYQELIRLKAKIPSPFTLDNSRLTPEI